MKAIESLVRENIRNLTPCVHGAEIYRAAEENGLQPEEILDFSSSVNPLGPSKKALVATESAFNTIAAYPDTNSNLLRTKIASRFSRLSKDNIIIGNGSTELMYLFAEAFLKKGEKALIPAPTFGEYERAVRKTGESPKFLRLSDPFQIDPEEFKLNMVGVKLAFLCNPNTPTSKLIPRQTLSDILEAALDQGILIFLDEDFLEFVENNKNLSMINEIDRYPNLFILRSFTKIYGLTGLRIGYGISNRDIIDVLMRSKIPWNINCLVQPAAVAALEDEKHLQTSIKLIKTEKKWLQTELEKFSSLVFCNPDANFFFINIQKTGFTANGLKQRLLKHRILIRDCSSFNGLNEFYVRIAVKTHYENMKLIEALKLTLK